MREHIEHLRRRLRGMPRYIAAVMGAGVLVACLFALFPAVDLVTVVDSGVEHATLLTATDEKPTEIIRLLGVKTDGNDEVTYVEHTENVASISIRRAFPVTLRVDNQTYQTEVLEGTVADLLAEAGVELGAEDFVEPAPDTPLEEDLAATVYRVTYVKEHYQKELTHEEVDAYKETLDEEARAAFVESYNAVYDALYEHRKINGETESSRILELTPQLQPRPADSYEIQQGVPNSRITGFEDVDLDANGLPVNYSWKMDSAITAAYSSSGGRGASGLGLYCGTVAVNPNVIPYGTRLYITSPDGSFVYGFAIATDTGVALMEGVIAIDLYFETNAECLQFGKRGMDVYILD